MSTPEEHEIETFLRVQAKLDELAYRQSYGGTSMTVRTNAPLCQALEMLSNAPFMSLPLKIESLEYTLSIAGIPAGALDSPDVNLILEKSTPSAFGKGDKTIVDETYRRGKEIPGADIGIAYANAFNGQIQREISHKMFKGRWVNIKLHKLAVYEEGGHFDWHMDSTHNDGHHATVLVALNTSWLGGDIVLKRGGAETRVDMKPKLEEDNVILQAISFFTDTEHKVEPVSEGVRIVLQYDVEVSGWAVRGMKRKREDSDNEPNEDSEEEEDEYEEEEKGESVLEAMTSTESEEVAGDPKIVKKVAAIVKELLESNVGPVDEVGFALQYLYRKSSILPEFLKGSDALVYQALAEEFDVSLRMVVLRESTDGDGSYKECEAYLYDDDESVESGPAKAPGKKSSNFYVPFASAIQMISSQEYIEHTGNECQQGENKYVGGGMFVRRRKVAA